jgi:YidC/Oxa1 family membrane protein insertase
VDTFLTAGLAHLVQVFDGSLGAAIIALSLGIRLSLLPLTIRLSRRALRNQAIAKRLQPEAEALKKRFAKDPTRLFREMQQLYQKHNYRPVDGPAFLGGFLQWPIFALLYRTIRNAVTAKSAFLWIRNLAAPDLALTLLILALTGLSAYWLPGASNNARSILILVQIMITSLIVWKLAAGLGLYWASSNIVGLFQSWWLRKTGDAPTSRA